MTEIVATKIPLQYLYLNGPAFPPPPVVHLNRAADIRIAAATGLWDSADYTTPARITITRPRFPADYEKDTADASERARVYKLTARNYGRVRRYMLALARG